MFCPIAQLVAGGQDEFQGKAIYTFTRSDGTQLGAQAHCAWLQSCEIRHLLPTKRRT